MVYLLFNRLALDRIHDCIDIDGPFIGKIVEYVMCLDSFFAILLIAKNKILKRRLVARLDHARSCNYFKAPTNLVTYRSIDASFQTRNPILVPLDECAQSLPRILPMAAARRRQVARHSAVRPGRGRYH